MSDFTFLTLEQAYGPNRLKILEKYKKDCEITDLATLLGGKSLEGEIGKYYINWSWWTKNFTTIYAKAISKEGNLMNRFMEYKNYGGRPAISYKKIRQKCRNTKVNEFGILETEYGMYPQQVAKDDVIKELEKVFLNNTLKKTGNKYSFRPSYSLNRNTFNLDYDAYNYDEYEYEGKRYIRFITSFKCDYTSEELSNNRYPSSYDVIWLEVQPIKWLIDKQNDIALSEKILFSGVPFHDAKGLYSFENSDIKRFMDDFFAKEILTGVYAKKEKSQNVSKVKVTKINVAKMDEITKQKEESKKEKSKVKVKVK